MILLLRYDAAEFLSRELKPFEEATRLIAEFVRTSDELQTQLFRGVCSKFLPAGREGFLESLEKLSEFLQSVKAEWDDFGRPGQKEDVVAAHFLVIATEFVWLRTRKRHYANLSELFGHVSNSAEPRKGELLSPEAIRQKRNRLKMHYPLAYMEALQLAQGCSRVPEPDEQDWMMPRRSELDEPSAPGNS